MMSRSLTALVITLVTIPTGIAWRMLPLGLPWFLYKYGGSFLWAVALYWFIAALLPKLSPLALATISTLIALLVEFSRLVPQSTIDAFRLTLAGQLILGRFFSFKNIAAYLFAIVCSTAVDHYLRPGHAFIKTVRLSAS
jgi:Protein of unknown function (DUF2809)